MEFGKVNLNELISPEWNPRQISEKEMEKLKNSIMEFDYIDPIIVNKHNNHIVGGNQRYLALKTLGYTEVDAVFIDEPDINKEKALNIALNKISGDWDTMKLEEILQDLSTEELNLTGFESVDLEDMNIDLDFGDMEIFDSDDIPESKYSNKIDIPHYEITGAKPEISELVDTSKTLSLQNKIINSNLPEDVQDFLINASYRFLEFNYGNIAEYYAHADKELQEIMEDLALVIIDFDKAIADGYVEFSEKMREIVERDYGDLDE